MNGNCDFCPRPGRLATCMCVHEHRVGVNVCAEKHEPWLGSVEIACRICYEGERHHVCALHEIPDTPTPSPAAVQHATGTPTTPSTDNAAEDD